MGTSNYDEFKRDAVQHNRVRGQGRTVFNFGDLEYAFGAGAKLMSRTRRL